jgi:hypothetical protein
VPWFAQPGASADSGIHTQKWPQQWPVVKQRIAESLGAFRVIFSEVADDFRQSAFSAPVGEAQSEIHLGRFSNFFQGNKLSGRRNRLTGSL